MRGAVSHPGGGTGAAAAAVAQCDGGYWQGGGFPPEVVWRAGKSGVSAIKNVWRRVRIPPLVHVYWDSLFK